MSFPPSRSSSSCAIRVLTGQASPRSRSMGHGRETFFGRRGSFATNGSDSDARSSEGVVMRLRRLAVPAVVLVFSMAIAAIPGFAISKEFNQSYSLQPGGTFELQNVNGPVEVQGWDRDVVEVHAVKTAKHNEADLRRVTIEVEAKPKFVSVTTHYPADEGVEVAVEYVIHVPHTAHVEHIGTINGTVVVAGVTTVDELRTVNGNIEVYDGGGGVHAHTTNGNIHLELANFPEGTGTSAETTNGSLLVALPSD